PISKPTWAATTRCRTRPTRTCSSTTRARRADRGRGSSFLVRSILPFWVHSRISFICVIPLAVGPAHGHAEIWAHRIQLQAHPSSTTHSLGDPHYASSKYDALDRAGTESYVHPPRLDNLNYLQRRSARAHRRDDVHPEPRNLKLIP
ncbi:hypothetical protein NEOLEDRAFT_1173409, partial [Neolentinus lepideus HHB14362 ss-1]